ncbi:MAG: bifunctional hydroxymethylpyrimidine kinase/phosphomethylpyrimidine kinase [Bacillota bacterium]|nr:bifunctional hydroxymethylpyrimidine kinase/phosphomethylpyrimidine kinase [Bacillota bacterium]
MIPRALTIAGSDSGGGAGIQIDLKVFTLLGVWGMSAVTAITAQNTLGVFGIHNLPASAIAEQIDAVVTDIGVDAVKTGMLSIPEHVRVVVRKVTEYRLGNLVVDPVMVAKGGARLIGDDARAVLRDELLPLATVVTPNIPEAEVLTGMRIAGLDDMREAARKIVALGAHAVLVKGGHMVVPAASGDGEQVVDIFYDGHECIEFSGPKFYTKNTHGTGCSLSAAIAAELAKGRALLDAVRTGRKYIEAAIAGSLSLGGGHGPTNPWSGAREAGSRGRCWA